MQTVRGERGSLTSQLCVCVLSLITLDGPDLGTDLYEDLVGYEFNICLLIKQIQLFRLEWKPQYNAPPCVNNCILIAHNSFC